jgi:transposase
MYCDVRQWRHIRRRIMVKGTPKKQVSRETGISRQTINRMLAHEFPPGYHPRPRRYSKLGPYIHTIDYLFARHHFIPAEDRSNYAGYF